MSLDLESALEGGLSRSLSRTAGVLALGFLVVALLTAIFQMTAQLRLLEWLMNNPDFVSQLPPDTQTQLQQAIDQSQALTLPISGWVAGLLALAMFFPREFVRVVSIRALANEGSDAGDRAGLFDGIAVVYAFELVAVIAIGILFGLLLVAFPLVLAIVPLVGPLLTLGSYLIVVPVAIFLAVNFAFVKQEIVLGDAGPIEAFSNSWSLTKGNRLLLFLLLLLLLVLNVGFTLVVGAIGAALPQLASTVLDTIISAVVLVFSIAVVTAAYLEVAGSTADEGTDSGAETADDDRFDDPPGIDADW